MVWFLVRWHTLKARITLFTLAIFLVSIWGLEVYITKTLQEDMSQILQSQQFVTVSLVATELEQEISDRFAALATISSTISKQKLNNLNALQLLLEERPVFANMFNAGIFITDENGIAIASIPLDVHRHGANYLDRDHVYAALKESKAIVAKPILGKLLNSPIVSLASPIIDKKGKVIGSIVGTIDLSKPNFLQTISNTKYGNTGGYIVAAPKHRIFVAATDKTYIMKSAPPVGKNPLMDRYFNGFEGSGIVTDARGLEVMSSAKKIPSADWVLIGRIPTAEAFAPVFAMQDRMHWATVFLTILSAILTWWMLNHQFRPITTAALRLKESEASHTPLPIIKHDEVGELIGGFNTLLETLSEREQKLKDSEFRWKFAIEGSGDGLWDWEVKNDTAYFTNQFKKMLGYNDTDYTSRGWTDRIHPDDKEETISKLQGFVTGLYSSFSHEHRLLCASGLYIWVTNRGAIVSRNENGDAERIIGTIRNITHRREQEDAIKALAFYDPLTKLPNRRLFDDRLAQCMTMSKRNNTYAVLMFLDLDNFKELNDTHGHSVGDMLLVEAAHRLKNCVRETDTVARFGGDEFTVIVNDAGKTRDEAITHAKLIAEKIRDVISVPYELIQTDKTKPESVIKHQCNVSIGFTAFINHEAVQEDIVKWADKAMYDAKETGTNLIRYFDDHKDK